MALGSNLKRVKKDNLIPEKKKETTAKAKKTASGSKSKPQKEEIIKAPPKTKRSTPVAASKVKESKPASTTTAKKSEPVAASKAKKTEAAPSPKEPKSKASPASKAANLTLKPNLEEKVLLGGDDSSAITVKLIPSRRKSVRKTKLVFEGSLSLLEAEAIKDCLLSTFNDFDLIDIELSNITHIDIIAIQLIKVFIDSHPDKTVKVDSDLPFDLKIIVERSGFGSLMFKEEVA